MHVNSETTVTIITTAQCACSAIWMPLLLFTVACACACVLAIASAHNWQSHLTDIVLASLHWGFFVELAFPLR